MKLYNLRIAVVLAALINCGPQFASADEPVQTEPTAPQLHGVWSDDFSTDTRDQYQIEGDVTWEQGKLTLAEGASITREVNGGSWVRMDLTLSPIELNPDEKSELRIWLFPYTRTPCFVRMTRDAKTPDELNIALLETTTWEGKQLDMIVREAVVQLTDEPLQIEYRHNLVSVTAEGKELLLAYLENGASFISQVSIQSWSRKHSVLNCTLNEENWAKEFPEEKRKSIADAFDVIQKASQLLQQGKVAEARRLGEEVLAVHGEILNEGNYTAVNCLAHLAILFRSVGDYPRAEPLFLEAIAMQEKVLGKSHPDYAASLANLAMNFRAKGDYSRAEPLYLEAIVIYGKVFGKEHPAYATCLKNLGFLYYSMGDYAPVEPLYLRAKAIREEMLGKEHPDYADSLKGLVDLYASKGDYARAELYYVESRAIGEKDMGKEYPDFATRLNSLANSYYSKHDYSRAEPLYLQALSIQAKVLGKEHPDYATSLNNLGHLYKSMADYSRAEPLYLEAIAIREKVHGKEHRDYATSLNNLGYLYKSMADYSRAEPLYLEAIAILEKTLGKEHPSYANSLNNLAALYRTMGDFSRAEPLYLEAKAILEKVRDKEKPLYATCLNNLALLYDLMADYSRAEPLYLEAKAIREKVLGKEHPSYAASLNNLAGLYDSMGDFSRAEPLYWEAKEIIEKVHGKEHPLYAASLNNLASLYDSMSDFSRAEPLYLQAKAIREKVLGKEHPDYATSLNNLGSLYESMADHSRAEPLFLEAKAIRERVLGKEHPDYATSLNNLGCLYVDSNRIDLAIPLYEGSLTIRRERIRDTAAILSERQQLAMNQDMRGFLDNYIRACLLTSPTPPNAVPIVMLWKGSVLYRQRQMRKASDDPMIADQFSKLQQAVRRLSQLAQAPPESDKLVNWKQQIAKLTAEKEVLESDLSRQSAAFRDAMQEITFAPIQQAIPADAVLVDYLEYIGKDGRSLQASIVRPNVAQMMIDLGSANEAGEAVDVWRETFGMSPQGKAAGLSLRKQIWEPLLEHIGDARTILVSTDGVLGRLPLAALPGKEPGTYLLEDHRLALIPAPQLLPALVNELGKRQRQVDSTQAEGHGDSLLLVGDVDYGSVASTQSQPTMTWGELSETRAEVEYIGDLYQRVFSPPADAVIDLRQAAATETAFRELAPKCVYLHLATHGFFAAADKKSALSGDMIALAEKKNRSGLMGQNRDAVVGLSPGQLSGLVFAGANRRLDATQIAADEDDGILTADEIAFLPLENVQLAVLSACETGLGEVAGGEGLLGIQRGFQIAGAKSVVASLWKVDDAATRRFMQEFYTNLLEKKMSTLDALREAQLWALKHPADVAFAVRGPLVSRPDAAVVGAVEDPTDERLSPRYWAPFVLSGDWR